MTDREQDLVASVLASMPPPEVPADFVARVNARIDETSGLFGLADFRAWTLRLAPLAAGLALIAVFWPGAATASSSSSQVVQASTSFTPTSASDWQQDVSADALLAAALTRADHAR
jgi:hypothetical protein